ncbi:arginyltransferase [Vibrio sp. HN007]|uniref:arginyltransferase n=1 Tax=Vibrio iocasae TaxID=3098914 RepID=UPI0035D400AD
MIPETQQIKIGLSTTNPCNYLEREEERVAVALDQAIHCNQGYELLLANGFRRSGGTIYTPHCPSCNKCQAIRLSISDLQLTKSQKRLVSKASHLRWELKNEMDENWFDLYSDYITKRHSTGSMYPPKKDEFFQFATCEWLNTQFLHVYDADKLILIAITDVMDKCASAFYTFFDPDYPLSLGTLGVLYQTAYCKQTAKQWLYLGYQIDECAAMNYKVRFHRHQRLVNHRWQG